MILFLFKMSPHAMTLPLGDVIAASHNFKNVFIITYGFHYVLLCVLVMCMVPCQDLVRYLYLYKVKQSHLNRLTKEKNQNSLLSRNKYRSSLKYHMGGNMIMCTWKRRL